MKNPALHSLWKNPEHTNPPPLTPLVRSLPLHSIFLLALVVIVSLTIAGITRAAPLFPPAAVPVYPAQTSLYRLLPNDIVHIRVFQEDELETSARISKSGTIPFPLLGSPIIGGRSIPEATALLESRLKEFLVQPQVAIRIVEYSKRKFTVLGQVSRPGVYDFPDDSALTLLEAIGMAGGYSRIANPSKITLKRTTQTGEQIFHLDGKRMARDRAVQPFPLTPGDTIVIGESLF